jgi:hypothetical protein
MSDTPIGPTRRHAIFQTSNTKVAAAFATLGLPFIDKNPVSNIYDGKRPFKQGFPGTVTYSMATESSTHELSSNDMQTAWEESTADKELDAVMKQLEAECTGLAAATMKRLKKTLPLAILTYLKAGLENRERIAVMWKNATPLFMFRKSENAFVLVAANASEEVKQRLGVQNIKFPKVK